PDLFSRRPFRLGDIDRRSCGPRHFCLDGLRQAHEVGAVEIRLDAQGRTRRESRADTVASGRSLSADEERPSALEIELALAVTGGRNLRGLRILLSGLHALPSVEGAFGLIPQAPLVL